MAPPQQDNSRDVALAAIAEALRLTGQPDEKLAQFDELEKERQETHDLSDARSAKPVEMSSRSRPISRSLVGVLALACIGVAVLAWQSSHGQVAPEPISTSSVPIKKKQELPTRPSPHDSDLAARTNAGLPEPQVQTTLQPAPTAPIAAPMAPELAQKIEMIARELANVEQGIDQLKTVQSQMVRDNAELAEHLKATQEIGRRNADLIEDLKAAEAQMARDNSKLAEQLKESQDQMASIAELLKEGQEQVARLVASGQKQRPRTLASSPLANVNSTRRPVTTPPSAIVRVPTHDPRPKQ
jgi:hypothetical protein